MRSRQYYKDTETHHIYYIDLCYGNYNECLNALSIFIENFNTNCMLYLSFDLDKMDMIKKFIPENVKNNIVMYGDVGNIDALIELCDRFHTSRYVPLTTYNHHTLGKNNKKEKQKVFNITKNYVRELKIKRVLNEV